ncbi:hypothetical protein Lal_00034612 [Lupinus albus]|nr:hypothetical protein Lal_00034612 [Lupinus albus]
MVPVSSPMRHSAMREGRARRLDDRLALLGTLFTGSEETTFTVRVCPFVPGFSCSTLMNTGFLFAAVAGGVAMLRFCGCKRNRERTKISVNFKP